MHQISFFAYHLSQQDERFCGATAVNRFAHLYGYGAPVGHWFGEHTGLAVFAPQSDQIRVPLLLNDPARCAATTYFPFGATRFADRADIVSGRYLEALHQRPERAHLLDAPAAVVAVDKNTGRLTIAGDSLGHGRIYIFKRGAWTVWSNKPAAGYIVTGTRPEACKESWLLFAALGWFGAEGTPYANVTKCRGDGYFLADRYGVKKVPLPPLMDRVDIQDTLRAEHYDAVAHSLTRKFQEIELFADPAVLSIGLSGGRDSRVATAAAITTAQPLAIHTAYPPMAELILAQRLMQRAAKKPEWRMIDKRKSATMQQSVTDDHMIEHSIRRAYLMCDGDSLISAIHRPARDGAPYLSSFTAFRISGGTGELAHANGYTAKHLSTITAEWRLQRARDAFARVPLVRSEARQAAIQLHSDTEQRGRQRGFTGFHLLDHWYIESRFRRWGMGNASIETALPLNTPEFNEWGFCQSVEQKLTAALHREIVQRLMPEWSDVPFSFEIIAALPIRNQTNIGSIPYLWETGRWPETIGMVEQRDFDDCFSRNDVLAAFRDPQSIPEDRKPQYASLIDRILWRSEFERYCAIIENAATSHQAPLALRPSARSLSQRTESSCPASQENAAK